MKTRRNRHLHCEQLDDRLAPANLTLTGLQLVDAFNLPQANPVFGQKLYVKATFASSGMIGGESVPLRMTANGFPLDSGNIVFAAGSGSSTLTLNGWYAGTASLSVTAMIDPNNVLVESNEADNSQVLTLTPAAPTDLANKFITPLGRGAFSEWAIGNYADVDPRPGFFVDAKGGAYTYDGHDAIDAHPFRQDGMDTGFPIFAAADGVVSTVQDGQFDRETVFDTSKTGNGVIISHGTNWETVYWHFAKNSITVKVGDSVKAGQLLGLMGSSGTSTQAHLHFNARYRGAAIEPLFAPSTYWKSPLPYAGEVAPFVLDAYVTNLDPVPDLQEGPPRVNTFALGQTGTINFPVETYNVKTPSQTAAMTWKIFRPDSTLFNSIPLASPTLSKFSLWYVQYPLSAFSNTLGTWSYSFEINGVEMKRVPFTIAAAGDPSIRLSTAGNAIVVDGRTTPYEFGSVGLSGSSTPQTFTIQNHGSSPLTLSNFKAPTGFFFAGPTPTTIAPNTSATFAVQMETLSAGAKFGAVTFTTNDPDTQKFDFNVSGTVTGPLVVGAPVVSLVPQAIAYNYKSQPRKIGSDASVNDSDSSNFSGGTLTAEIASGGDGFDALSIKANGSSNISVSGSNVTNDGAPIGTFTGGTAGAPLVISFNSTQATTQVIRNVIRNLQYTHTSNSPVNNRRYVRLMLVDNTGKVSNLAIINISHSGVEKAPTITPLPTTVVTTNPTITQPGSFSDPHGNSWTAIVDYGDGTGPQPLALNPDNTFTLSHTYAQPGLYNILISIINDQGGSSSGIIAMSVSPPTNVSSYTVNNGAAQRSRLTTISVNFTNPVDAGTLTGPGAISLERSKATGFGLVGTRVETGAVGGHGRILVAPASGTVSSITLTFDNADGSPIGDGVESGSLADGRWQLAIPSQFFISVFDDPNLRRLFGDGNNDGTVDGSDLGDFGAAFGQSVASPFDYDANNTVDATDFAAFGARFGITL